MRESPFHRRTSIIATVASPLQYYRMVEHQAPISPTKLDQCPPSNLRRKSSRVTLIVCLLVVLGVSSAHNNKHQQPRSPFMIQRHTYFSNMMNSLCLRGGNVGDDSSVDPNPEPTIPVDLSVDNNITSNQDLVQSSPSSAATPIEEEDVKQLYFEDFVPDELRLQEENQIFETEEANFPDNFPDTDVDGEDLYAHENQDIFDAMAKEEEKFPETFPDTDVEGEDESPKEEVTLVKDLLSKSEPHSTEITESKKESFIDSEVTLAPFTAVSSSVTVDDDSSAYLDRMDLADAYDDEESDNKEIRETVDGMSASNQSAHGDVMLVNQKVGSRQNSFTSEAIPVMDDDMEDTSVKIQYMITEEMKRVLMGELGYSKVEVENMKPDVATVLVNKMLKCPKNGMPEAFYIEGRIPKSLSRRDTHILGISKKVITRIVIPALTIGATWGLKIFLEGSSTQSISSFSQGKRGKYVKRGKTGKKFYKKGSSSRNVKGTKTNKAKVVDSKKKRSIHSIPTETGQIVSLTNATSLRKDEQAAITKSSSMPDAKDNAPLTGRQKATKDLDKTWLDRVVSITLEKMDEIFKRPF